MADNLPRGTPARVLILFSLLLAGVAVFSWKERASVPDGVSWPTAAGQTDFFDPAASPAGIQLNGAMRIPVSKETVRRDESMFRVRQTGGDGRMQAVPSVFTDREGPVEQTSKLYVRTSPGRYRRLR